MITKVILNNFQSHENTVITLPGRGVTAIIGDSDVGKSALFRGLRWFLTGRPVGKDVVRRGQNICKVGVVLDNGTTLFRVWANGKNYYYVNGEKRENFGNSFPEEIQKLVNITTENIIEQFDWFSLFYKSPADLAKHFNSIVDLNGMHNVLDFVDKKKRDLEKDLIKGENRRQHVGKQVSSTRWVNNAAKMLELLKNEKGHYDEVVGTKNTIQELVFKCEQFLKFKVCLEKFSRAEQEIAIWEKDLLVIMRVKEIVGKLEKLSPLVENVRTGGKIDEMGEYIHLFQELASQRRKLTSLIGQITALNKGISKLKWDISKQTKCLRNFDICPLCGQIKENK